MCGIVGVWANTPRNGLKTAVSPMLHAIRHRGPDADGVWEDKPGGLVLGHRRLSILDLSQAGAQPMESACGRYAMAYNGEIYNFEDLRAELALSGAAQAWRGHSDSEVLLAAISFWGVEETLKRCTGMFAFAVWDKQARTLTLARDRLGEKPLYYGQVGRDFVFGSELASFYCHPHWEGAIDRNSITLMMRHNYIPAPYSAFEGIYKLEPGTWMTLTEPRQKPEPEIYWSARQTAIEGQKSPYLGSPEEAVDELHKVLSASVKAQMVSDVPLGAFLSGGIDSSTIVALMQEVSEKPVRTFTIGFNEAGYNEAVHARAVAEHLKTDHTELYVSDTQAMDIVPRLPTIYSEPFSDSSQIPTFLVSQLAREQVSVALSGDGGDELFSGYTRYSLSESLWKNLSRAPLWARRGAASALTAIPARYINRLSRPVLNALPPRYRAKRPGDLAHKLAGVIALQSRDEVYRYLVSHWQNPEMLMPGTTEPGTAITRKGSADGVEGSVRRMMLLDAISYLPDDILTKVDRASMAVSLETRVPMLDHNVVAFASSLPMQVLRQGGHAKWPLRSLLYRYVPQKLVDRPKMGFGIPVGDWLRGGLADWAHDLLSEEALSDGFFDPAMVRQVWQEHCSGQRNNQYLLWDVLMFQAWHREHRDVVRNTQRVA